MSGDQMDHADPMSPLLPTCDGVPRRRSFRSTALSIFTANTFFIALGPLLCAAVCLFVRFDSYGAASQNMLGVLVWVFAWWITEAVPMPVTSMSPLFLFPLFGIASADDVAKSYMDDVITLILGSFILVLAVEHYNIHRRLALNITVLFCGDPMSPPLLLLGICGTTFFISMWMHNVAVAVMMMPVAVGILHRLPSAAGGQNDVVIKNFCRAVILGVTYATPLGGSSTLTGTGVNLILVGMWKSYYPSEDPISYSTWFLFGFPLAVLIFLALWALLCIMYLPKGSGRVLSGYLDKAHLKRELELLGPMAFSEKMILAVFLLQVVLWMTKNITDDIPGWGVLFKGRAGDGTVSVMVATLLFIIPDIKQRGKKLMDWNKCKNLPWNIILLLGAGFAIADGLKTSGLADVLATTLDFLEGVPYWAIAPSVCIISAVITELISSNDATATLVLPLLVQMARTMHVHPLLLMVPGAIGTQFAFLLPMSTPSNVVGLTTGHIEVRDMIKTGLPLKVAGVAILSVLMPTLGAVVFGTNKPALDWKLRMPHCR